MHWTILIPFALAIIGQQLWILSLTRTVSTINGSIKSLTAIGTSISNSIESIEDILDSTDRRLR